MQNKQEIKSKAKLIKSNIIREGMIIIEITNKNGKHEANRQALKRGISINLISSPFSFLLKITLHN